MRKVNTQRRSICTSEKMVVLFSSNVVTCLVLRAQTVWADIAPPPARYTTSSDSSLLFLISLAAVAYLLIRLSYSGLKILARGIRGEGGKVVRRQKRGMLGWLVGEVLFLLPFAILAGIIIPNFLNFRLKAKSSEAKSNLGAIRSTEVAYYAEWSVWVGNQPLTPTPVYDRAGNRRYALWDNNTRFSILGFAPEGGVWCSYALEGTDFPAAEEGFVARAECDYDGDGKLSIYWITSSDTEVRHSGAPF